MLKIHEWGRRPAGCFIERILTYSQESYDLLTSIKSPSMDVVLLPPDLGDKEEGFLGWLLADVACRDHPGKYARVLLLSDGDRGLLDATLRLIYRDTKPLLDEWRVHATVLTTGQRTRSAMFEAVGMALPAMMVTAPGPLAGDEPDASSPPPEPDQ